MEIFPKVPIVFKSKFPSKFVNSVFGWGAFSEKELKKHKGKLLHLDIDFGNVCSLNCPHCFRKENKVDYGKRKLLDYDQLVKLILEAKKLGLKTVKFLGAGEPFENKRFLEFLRFLNANKISASVFTKGHVIGDDKLAKRYNEHYGISNGKQLAKELYKLKVGILLGFNSFDVEVQDKMVGGIKGYSLKRNKALLNLVQAGFNKANPTRLCFVITPITKRNLDQILKIYKWARKRNIFPVTCPTMISGRCAKDADWKKITPSKENLIKLYTEIYKYNFKTGIQTLKQVKEEGVSPYAGAYPCTQMACGMYITLGGVVLRCPGDDVTKFGDIWKSPLKDIWLKSENYKRAGIFNCGCPPKEGKSIPNNFYRDVLARLEKSQKK